MHGLQGGSRKTWSSSKRLEHFWPKEWLSRDPGFQNARVHSFGYKSDWMNTKSSILNINHIAGTLLASIQSSPSMRETPHSKIIFVAHSMGGLLVKKVRPALYLIRYEANNGRRTSRLMETPTMKTSQVGLQASSSSVLRTKDPIAPSRRSYSSLFHRFMVPNPMLRTFNPLPS